MAFSIILVEERSKSLLMEFKNIDAATSNRIIISKAKFNVSIEESEGLREKKKRRNDVGSNYIKYFKFSSGRIS